MNTHRWLPLAALVLAPLALTGCHTHRRDRVAYEIHYESSSVAYRAPTPRAYAHGHARHRCDARCDAYWPDVHAHGSASHRCDASCAQWFPQPTRRVEYRADTYAEATPVEHYEEHARAWPHGHSRHACSTGCHGWQARSTTVAGPVRITSYAHGHPRHGCDTSCNRWVWPHGHARHACTTTCGSYAWPHGHARHACRSSCGGYRTVGVNVGGFGLSLTTYQHGHASHRCHTGCHGWSAPRRHAAPVVVIHPHGHRLHACASGCHGWRAPSRHHHAPRWNDVGSSRVDLQACKLEYSIVSPK